MTREEVHKFHHDISNRMKLEELFASFESFERLRGMVLLFDRDSEYYKFSGFVTAALYDVSHDEIILAINGSLSGWVTHKGGKDHFMKMLDHCDAFVGEDAEHSFLLE